MPLAWISLTLSRHPSLSFIAFGRSSGLHPVSLHSCCMYVRAGHPAFAWPYAGVHRSTSLTSSSLLLQQCPVCLAHVTCVVFVIIYMSPQDIYIYIYIYIHTHKLYSGFIVFTCIHETIFGIKIHKIVYWHHW